MHKIVVRFSGICFSLAALAFAGAAQAMPISIKLTASKTVVPMGGDVTLRWQASNAKRCFAYGQWSGVKPVRGSLKLRNVTRQSRYRLSCSDLQGNGRTTYVVVGVEKAGKNNKNSNGGPTIVFTAANENIDRGQSTKLRWRVRNADSCVARGKWGGKKKLSGTFNTGRLTKDATYSLRCTKGKKSDIALVKVTVGGTLLRWRAPKVNEDGSRLRDLAGYKIYWGRKPNRYTSSQTINSASATSWKANLPPGRYYFALTAFDKAGNESDRSAPIFKKIL